MPSTRNLQFLKAEVAWPRDVESSTVAAPGCQGFRLGLGVVEVDLLVLHAITPHEPANRAGSQVWGDLSQALLSTPTASTDIIPCFHAASRGVDGEYFPNCAKQASALLPQFASLWPGTSSRTTWHSICLLNQYYNCRARLVCVWSIQEKVSSLWYLKF